MFALEKFDGERDFFLFARDFITLDPKVTYSL